MEITLEKIELVKDRTGVTYKEAKDALEKADGNVVDAIINIENMIDEQSSSKKISRRGQDLLNKMKEIVKRGNVSRIVIKKDGSVVLSMPVNVGVAGIVVAPWGVVAGVLAVLGFQCQVDLEKEDGSVITLTDKADEIFEDAKSKGSKVYDGIREKAPGFYEGVKNVSEQAKEKATKFADNAKDAADKIKSGADEMEDGFFGDDDIFSELHEENDGIDLGAFDDIDPAESDQEKPSETPEETEEDPKKPEE
ncbi:MAG: DUF4342 domain-containing protein [Anaerovoracaceae bacterium]|jgi:gas vesicle protein